MTTKVFLRLFSLGAVLSVLIFNTAYGDTTLQIMPLGDSITGGYPVAGGYREPLYTHLQSVSCDFVYVGSNTSAPSQSLINANPIQVFHEGHGGYQINQINGNLFGDDGSDGNNSGYWLGGTATREPLFPNIILLDAGANDVYAAPSAAVMRDRIDALINTIYTNRPDAAVLVANMIPRTNFQSISEAYNALIPDLVESYDTAGRKCYFVDMHSALTLADLSDSVHPNAAGYQKMANTWFAALQTNDLISVPEPSSLMMLFGLVGMILLIAKSKHNR